MKKVLLGSTAIVGVALLASVPALAAEKPTVTVSGYLDFQTGWSDQDIEGFTGGGTDRGFDFMGDSEVHIKASGQADNGIKYGVKIELEGDSSTLGQSDEAVITISGNWGRIQLGDEDGAEDIMLGGHTGVGNAGTGGIDGDHSRWYQNVATGTTSFPDITDTSDATKITYYTPRFNGFQMGVSYTPDTSNSGQTRGNTRNGGQENHIGIGANFVSSFNDVDVSLAVVGSFSSGERTAAGLNTAGTRPRVNDFGAFGVGGTIGLQGFQIGGAYIDSGDGGRVTTVLNDDVDVFTIGVGYSGFPVNLEAGYLSSDSGNGVTGGGENSFDLFSIAADYPLGPGWAVYADLLFFDGDLAAPAGVDNSGSVLIFGTQVNF